MPMDRDASHSGHSDDSDAPLLGVRGCLIDTPHLGRLRERKDTAILIENGRIVDIGAYNLLHKKASSKARWLHNARAAIFPGLIDLHSHLPQYPAVAKGRSELLPWLRQTVFPLEREFGEAKARKESMAFFRELARHGTTTAMLYGSVNEAAWEAGEKSGVGVSMGMVMMDSGCCGASEPKKVMSIALLESERLGEKWHG